VIVFPGAEESIKPAFAGICPPFFTSMQTQQKEKTEEAPKAASRAADTLPRAVGATTGREEAGSSGARQKTDPKARAGKQKPKVSKSQTPSKGDPKWTGSSSSHHEKPEDVERKSGRTRGRKIDRRMKWIASVEEAKKKKLEEAKEQQKREAVRKDKSELVSEALADDEAKKKGSEDARSAKEGREVENKKRLNLEEADFDAYEIENSNHQRLKEIEDCPLIDSNLFLRTKSAYESAKKLELNRQAGELTDGILDIEENIQIQETAKDLRLANASRGRSQAECVVADTDHQIRMHVLQLKSRERQEEERLRIETDQATQLKRAEQTQKQQRPTPAEIRDRLGTETFVYRKPFKRLSMWESHIEFLTQYLWILVLWAAIETTVLIHAGDSDPTYLLNAVCHTTVFTYVSLVIYHLLRYHAFNTGHLNFTNQITKYILTFMVLLFFVHLSRSYLQFLPVVSSIFDWVASTFLRGYAEGLIVSLYFYLPFHLAQLVEKFQDASLISLTIDVADKSTSIFNRPLRGQRAPSSHANYDGRFLSQRNQEVKVFDPIEQSVIFMLYTGYAVKTKTRRIQIETVTSLLAPTIYNARLGLDTLLERQTQALRTTGDIMTNRFAWFEQEDVQSNSLQAAHIVAAHFVADSALPNFHSL